MVLSLTGVMRLCLWGDFRRNFTALSRLESNYAAPSVGEDFQKAENSNDPVVKYYKRYAIIAVWDQHADFCCKAIRLVFRAIHHKVEQFSVYVI